ncbi:MAG: hypothetical protein ABSE64_07225 [Vulcanimicrobiaceae bacterium]|jgi:hypothetical protein
MNDIASVSNASVGGSGQADAARPLAFADLASEKQDRLPRDYPRQPGDTISLSTQAGKSQSGASLPPEQPMSFWDHDTKSAPVGDRNIGLDASGSYKLD